MQNRYKTHWFIVTVYLTLFIFGNETTAKDATSYNQMEE